MSSRIHECPKCGEKWYCEGCETEATIQDCNDCAIDPVKTYADKCLARAEKATKGAWTDGFHIGEVETSYQPDCCEDTVCGRIAILNSSGLCRPSHQDEYDAEFIACARTDVPELANRLKRAIQAIKDLSLEHGDPCDGIIDELEKPL